MRIESSVTSISWIPSEAIEGIPKLEFEMMFHYDSPPPDVLKGPEQLEQLRASDAFRFANELRAWIEIEDGRITRYGHTGRSHSGITRWRMGPVEIGFAAIPLPELRPDPVISDTSARFVQTAGVRTGFPIQPRRGRGMRLFQLSPALPWTTLGLTINVDGSSKHEVVGASPFPRHWIYDQGGRLVQKTGVLDYKSWALDARRKHTPWGDEESPALVTEVETALERELSRTIMRGGEKPRIKKVSQGDTLVKQGELGEELFLLLDGVLEVEVDGNVLAEVGPGAILGERALLEGGKRTATLRAVTPIKVAVASPDQVALEAMVELARGHRREES